MNHNQRYSNYTNGKAFESYQNRQENNTNFDENDCHCVKFDQSIYVNFPNELKWDDRKNDKKYENNYNEDCEFCDVKWNNKNCDKDYREEKFDCHKERDEKFEKDDKNDKKEDRHNQNRCCWR